MNTSRLALTLGMLCVLLAPALRAQDVLITPSAITSSTSGTDVSPAGNLINGSGLSGTPTLAALGSHASSNNINAWVTATSSPTPDYFVSRPQPVLTCTLSSARLVSELVLWGFDGNSSEAKSFNVAFSTDNGTSFANAVLVTQPTLLGTGAVRLPLPEGPRLASHVRVTVTDNHFGTGVGGDRVVLGELRFAAAPEFFVMNTADSGPGSLRQAVADAAAAPGADTITFAPALSGQTISLGSEIVISSSVEINATSLPAGLIITDTGDFVDYRLFSVSSGTTVTLRGLTLADGGGSSFFDSGGAISNNGTLTLTQCSLSGNSASFSGSGGAISNGGTLTLTQCSLSGNSAHINGGAIYNNGTLTLTQCSFSGNSAILGGAVYNHSSGTLALTNSIVAGNTVSSGGNGPDIYNQFGTVTPTGVNLIGNLTNSGLNAGPTVLVGAPHLAPLGNYGGPTQTMPPLPGSPAIDAGGTTALTTDQRGFARNVDGDGTGGAAPDIGAVEMQRVVVTTATDELHTPTGAQTSLREAIRDAAELIVFAPGLSGGTISLGSQIVISSSVEINATSLPAGLTINDGPGNSYCLFSVSSGTTVTLRGLTLTNGGGPFFTGDGGAISNNGTLTLTQCSLSGNSANFGGAIFNVGTLTLTQCTLSGNSTHFRGGAIYSNNGTLALTHCTLSDNSAGLEGGAIYNPVGTLTLNNSIVAGNTASDGPDIYRLVGTISPTGVNLIGDLADSGLSAGPTVLVGASHLAPLGNYGGPTQTMALLPGSPARDAALTSNTVQNSSFEADVVGGDYTYTGSITGWTSSSASLTGLSRAGSPFTNNGTIPQGTQVAFLQSMGSPATTLITTLTALTAGQSYTVSFRVSAREAYTTPALSWSVSSGATTLFSTSPTAIPAVGGTNPYGTVSGTFSATATTATLVIGNQTATGTDSTLLLDAVSVFPSATDQRGFPIVGTPDIGAYEAGTAANYAAYIWETLPTAGNGLTTDPLHAPTYDYDGDGQSNEAEWRALTDAASARSTFRVTETARSGNTFTITFPTVLGRSYQLQSSPSLADPWINIGAATAGTGGDVALPVNVTGQTSYFFRVSVGGP